MPPKGEAQLSAKRLEELALRADRLGQPVYSPFLSPPEAEAAERAAAKAGVDVALFGGYEGSERQMACFGQGHAHHGQAYPIVSLLLRWPHQSPPAHRDILGAVMGLGLDRHCIGDVLLLETEAYLFVEEGIAAHVEAGLAQAGRAHLQVERLHRLPSLSAPQGVLHRDTVSSLRLDAVVASGLSLSRTRAAALIATGLVKLRHTQQRQGDARVDLGDMISIRGYGRLRLAQVGQETRKGRLPIVVERFGMK